MQNYSFPKLIVLLLFTALFACGEDDDQAIEPAELVAPFVITPTQISATAFRVDWNAVTGAETYEVDVATDEAFTNFVPPYQSFPENGSGINVIDLENATTYYVRVRTIISGERSDNSNVISATTKAGTAAEPDTPLKDAATTFAVGMATSSNRLSGQHDAIYRREYNSITAEYEMKMDFFYPSKDRFDFSKADALVDYAQDNGMHVHGHALIWHNATPSWVENFSGTDEEFEAMVKDYILTVVSRYKGKVRSWDVVNEAFEDGSGALRNSVFRQRMGDDYIEKCYRWTREADPDVLIFYNDYNMVIDDTKRKAALDMVDDFKNRNVPVDGFGFHS